MNFQVSTTLIDIMFILKARENVQELDINYVDKVYISNINNQVKTRLGSPISTTETLPDATPPLGKINPFKTYLE